MTQYAEPGNRSMVSLLVGRWTYRSFINDPDISKDFSKLEFGRGELVIEEFIPGTFAGRLIFGDTYQFELSGSSSFGNSFTVRVRRCARIPLVGGVQLH
ncbi:MAG TPA: hypothetical protein VKB35_07030 [Ktedonobacteraceae bacterium]|nr:hypothetical protein [Ktedonobacteraceae bacterium]